MSASAERRTSAGRQRRRRGRRAEALAAWWLRLKLYRVLARRFRTRRRRDRPDRPARPHHRLRRGQAAAERSRGGSSRSKPAARKRIARAAELWIGAHPGARRLRPRFDVVVAMPGRCRAISARCSTARGEAGDREIPHCLRARRARDIAARPIPGEINTWRSPSPSRWTTSSKLVIRGDSTFALMLEAERRGHALYHYTPDRLAMRDGTVEARVEPVDGARRGGRPFHPRRRRRPPICRPSTWCMLRQDPPFDMGYITTTHLLERIHPETLVVNDPAHVRNAPEKLFVTEFTELMPPTLITRDRARDRRLPRGARRHHHQAALRQWRRRRLPHRRRRREPRRAARDVRGRLSRALHRPAIPARGARRATSASSWSTARRSASSTACRRPARRAPTCMSAAAPSRPR